MENKKITVYKSQRTVVEFTWDWIVRNPYASSDEGIIAHKKAREIHKEHMINFGKKVLDNISGRDIELIKPIEEIYKERYGEH